MQYSARRLLPPVLMLLLTCGFAVAFSERAHHDHDAEVALSHGYLPLAVDGCASPTPTPTLTLPPILNARTNDIVTVMNPSFLFGSPGDTLKFRGSLTNTTSQTYSFVGGYGLIQDNPNVCTGNAPNCPILGLTFHLATNPIPPNTSTGEVDIIDFQLNPTYTGTLPITLKYFFYAAGPTGVAFFTVTVQPRMDPARPPLLFTDPCTQRAIALDSVNFTATPFALANSSNFSSDQRTRVMLFAWNMNLQRGDGAGAVTVQALDSQQTIYTLPVEFVSEVPGVNGLTQIIVRLPDNLPQGTELRVRILIHGFTSNEAPMAVESC